MDTLFIGHTHIHVPSLPSTNTYAQELLASGHTAEGTLITAGYQENGRGQIGRSWYSSADLNILASIILRPAFIAAADQFQISIATSLALHSLVLQYLPEREITIKWPNDIYVDDTKIAGILIQNTLKGSAISSSIAGIGMNVNEVEWPAEIPNPTSIAKELHTHVPLDICLHRLVSHLEYQYLRLKAGHTDEQHKLYTTLLYRRNKAAKYQLENGEVVIGKIKGVDAKGRIEIALEHETRYFQFREITYLQDK